MHHLSLQVETGGGVFGEKRGGASKAARLIIKTIVPLCSVLSTI